MRNLFRLSILIMSLISACNPSNPGQPAPDITIVPDLTPAPITDTPPPEIASTECAFVWAREPLPDLSKEFDAALKGALPGASGYAETYGENCLNNQGEVARFLAMETDFYVVLEVETLEDKQTLGELIEQVLNVLARFPVEGTPGPQPGYIGITFQSRGDELRLWFPRRDAEAALENGLRGEKLFNALQVK
jgi:hypothetical protein